MNFQMFKLVLEKAEEPEIKLPTSVVSSKKQESSRETSISALLTMPKPLTVQFSSVAQSCPTLCDPVNRSTPRPPCPSPTPRVFLALCYEFKSKNTLPILRPKGFLKCFSLKVL